MRMKVVGVRLQLFCTSIQSPGWAGEGGGGREVKRRLHVIVRRPRKKSFGRREGCRREEGWKKTKEGIGGRKKYLNGTLQRHSRPYSPIYFLYSRESIAHVTLKESSKCFLVFYGMFLR